MLSRVTPPICCEDTEDPYLDNLQLYAERHARWPEQVEHAKAALRHVLSLRPEEELDELDEDLFMRAWAARNEPDVAMSAWDLARVCESLEEFEWYPFICPLAKDFRTRWTWKCRRKDDGSVRDVRGNFLWTDGLRGSPPPLHILVGEELANAQKLAARI